MRLCASYVQLEAALDMLEQKLTPRRIIRGKGSRSPRGSNRAPGYISWAATSAIALELAEAQELLRGPQESRGNPAAQPPPRRGPATPPLLQRPLAVDSDEEGGWGGLGAPADRPSSRLGAGRKRGKAKRRSGTRAVAENMWGPAQQPSSLRQMTDSSEIRKDALKRSVEAIESLSLALDSVNEEKKVLMRVLETCETSGSAVNKVALHAETLEGSSRLAQASFIAQMLPGVDPKVVERMPAKAISKNLCHFPALRSVLFLRMALAVDDCHLLRIAAHLRHILTATLLQRA